MDWMKITGSILYGLVGLMIVYFASVMFQPSGGGSASNRGPATESVGGEPSIAWGSDQVARGHR